MRAVAAPRRPSFLGVPAAEAVPAPASFARAPAVEPVPATFGREAVRPPAEIHAAIPAPRPGPAGAPAPEPVRDPIPELPPPASPARLPAEFLERLAVSIDTLRLHADRLTELCAADAIAVGAAIARRILEAELRANPEALFPLIRSALRKVGESRTVTVRLAPADAEAILARGSNVPAELAAATVRIAADPGLAPGDVQIDADFGTVDGRLATRLDEVRHALAAALGDEADGEVA